MNYDQVWNLVGFDQQQLVDMRCIQFGVEHDKRNNSLVQKTI